MGTMTKCFVLLFVLPIKKTLQISDLQGLLFYSVGARRLPNFLTLIRNPGSRIKNTYRKN